MSWLKTTVPRVVRRSVRESAMLLFAAGPAVDDAPCEAPCPRAPNPEAQAEARRKLRRCVCRSLDTRERLALSVSVGADPEAVAAELRLTRAGLRTLLHRLRRRLRSD